jgi:hypothetical protein
MYDKELSGWPEQGELSLTDLSVDSERGEPIDELGRGGIGMTGVAEPHGRSVANQLDPIAPEDDHTIVERVQCRDKALALDSTRFERLFGIAACASDQLVRISNTAARNHAGHTTEAERHDADDERDHLHEVSVSRRA